MDETREIVIIRDVRTHIQDTPEIVWDTIDETRHHVTVDTIVIVTGIEMFLEVEGIAVVAVVALAGIGEIETMIGVCPPIDDDAVEVETITMEGEIIKLGIVV